MAGKCDSVQKGGVSLGPVGLKIVEKPPEGRAVYLWPRHGCTE
jgi:hypothetical protein